MMKVATWRKIRRWVSLRLSGYCRAEDYGAVADGVTDCSEAFNVARCDGASLGLKHGNTYLVTAPLVLKPKEGK